MTDEEFGKLVAQSKAIANGAMMFVYIAAAAVVGGTFGALVGRLLYKVLT